MSPSAGKWWLTRVGETHNSLVFRRINIELWRILIWSSVDYLTAHNDSAVSVLHLHYSTIHSHDVNCIFRLLLFKSYATQDPYLGIHNQRTRIPYCIRHRSQWSVEPLAHCRIIAEVRNGKQCRPTWSFYKKTTKLLLHTSLDTIPYTNAKMICISWSNVVTGPSGRTKLTSPLPVWI